MDTLRRQYAAGRLSLTELETRVTRAYAARRREDLRELVADLPRVEPSRLARSFYQVQRRALTTHAALYCTAGATSMATWELTGGGEFWPAWILVPGAALLGWHAAASRALRRRLDGRARERVRRYS